MAQDSRPLKVALVGCGRLGSALVEGWLASGAVRPQDLIILTPSSKPAAEAAAAEGARINPTPEAVGEADVVVVATKPAVWREAIAPLAPRLGGAALIVSVMAGVPAGRIAEALGRPVARAMPTTAVAQGRGVAALWSPDSRALTAARRLFEPVADVTVLDGENQMDAATAVAGSGPAFIYAFVEALAEAGAAEGLSREAALRLAHGALRSAASGAETGAPIPDLISRIASPGGTTRAGLDAMAVAGDPGRAARAAVQAAVLRARGLQG